MSARWQWSTCKFCGTTIHSSEQFSGEWHAEPGALGEHYVNVCSAIASRHNLHAPSVLLDVLDVELDEISVWLAYGYDERQLRAFDTRLDFRGLADAVYLPAADFEIFIDDQSKIDTITIERVGLVVVDMYDSNSGTQYRYEPAIYRGQLVYLVESFGFSRVDG